MKIEFVNHASVILQVGEVKLMSDPWLFGSAFQNGWDLLCETQFDMQRFEEIDYIWFSHEHPDHFSPRVLAAIPEELRPGITILFQTTVEKKVLSFCKSLGFPTRELPDLQRVHLAPGLEVVCGSVVFYDSWLCIYAGGKTILNVNDCVVDADVKAKNIEKHTGKVDLLLSQFSYAGWKGGPEDKTLRELSAESKLNALAEQIRVFEPKYVIPFASYVFFSHEENNCLNDSVNKPQDAIAVIEREGSQAIVMSPAQEWTIGEAWSNKEAVSVYDKAYAAIPGREQRKAGESVPLDQIIDLSREFLDRMRRKNDFRIVRTIRRSGLFGFFLPFTIYLTDLNRYLEFDIFRGLTDVPKREVDVSMHSECLALVFEHDYGYDTLTVNGRFQASMPSFSKMTKNFGIASLNHCGRAISFKLITDVRILSTMFGMFWGFMERARNSTKRDEREKRAGRFRRGSAATSKVESGSRASRSSF